MNVRDPHKTCHPRGGGGPAIKPETPVPWAAGIRITPLFPPLHWIFTLCLTLFLVAGCTIARPTPVIENSSEEEGRGSATRDNSRGRGECDRDRRCESICDSIFQSRKAKLDCEELDIATVEPMEDVVKVLKDPNWDDLEALDINVLSALLKISLGPLQKAIGRMTQTEKKRFLEWVVLGADAAKTLEDVEDEFEILKELFGSGKETITRDLNKQITGGENFVTLAMDRENEVVLNWLHRFFEHICQREDHRKCVLTGFYCELSLDSREEEEFFGYDFFDELLDEVLELDRPSPTPALSADHWWEESGGTDAEDLDRWKTSPHNVCLFMKP